MSECWAQGKPGDKPDLRGAKRVLPGGSGDFDRAGRGDVFCILSETATAALAGPEDWDL